MKPRAGAGGAPLPAVRPLPTRGGVIRTLALATALIALPASGEVRQLPNLVAAPPSDIHLAYVDPYFSQGPRAIRFASAVGNLGPFPFEVTGIPATGGGQVAGRQCVSWVVERVCAGAWHDAGRYPFDPLRPWAWRAPGFAVYELRSLERDGAPDWGDAGLASSGGRSWVCPYDAGRIHQPESWLAGATNPPAYPICNGLRMGISPGWFDYVPAAVEDQHLAIEGVPDGRYALVIRVDANDRFLETNEGDNVAYKQVEVLNGGATLRTLR